VLGRHAEDVWEQRKRHSPPPFEEVELLRERLLPARTKGLLQQRIPMAVIAQRVIEINGPKEVEAERLSA
jgi:hypothetical protein